MSKVTPANAAGASTDVDRNALRDRLPSPSPKHPQSGPLLISSALGYAAPEKALRVIAFPAFRNRHWNPYTALLYEALQSTGTIDVAEGSWRHLALTSDARTIVHFHWPQKLVAYEATEQPLSYALKLLGFPIKWLLLMLARRRGAKFVWTVHNIHSHDQREGRLGGLLWRRLVRIFDASIHFSEGARDHAFRCLPVLAKKQAFIVPHGHYKPAYDFAISRAAARRRLGIAATPRVFLFFGQVRPYKGIDALIDAFIAYPDPSAILIIAGAPTVLDPPTSNGLSRAKGDPRIRLVLDYIAGGDVGTYVRACDALVLPYRDILNSGSAMLALSGARPVVAPARGSVEDLRARVGDAWVHAFDGPLTARVFADADAWLTRPRPRPPCLDFFDWTSTGNLLAEALIRVRTAPGKPPW